VGFVPYSRTNLSVALFSEDLSLRLFAYVDGLHLYLQESAPTTIRQGSAIYGY
jgi:hypothetical protein